MLGLSNPLGLNTCTVTYRAVRYFGLVGIKEGNCGKEKGRDEGQGRKVNVYVGL